jgi:hypothetical protein
MMIEQTGLYEGAAVHVEPRGSILHLLNHLDNWQDFFGVGSDRRKTLNYTGQDKHWMNANIFASIRIHDPNA